MSAFKAYDIRGIYGEDITEELAYRLGYFIPRLFMCNKVLVGYDTRLSSESLYDALCEGITDSGADVYSLGLATTPMVYYATAKKGFPASVQITASHNAKQYNGFKISRENAIPVGGDSGLLELEQMVLTQKIEKSTKKGTVIPYSIREEYIAFLREKQKDFSNLKIVIDCSNGMTSLIARELFGESATYLFDTLDGTFPNHEPNPLIEANCKKLMEVVKQTGADIGIVFDGDGDRAVIVDETGAFVSPDLNIAIMAKELIRQPGEFVLHDIRTSKSVSEYIAQCGGKPYMWKVGHAFAKMKMRELNAVYGGELAGHYYFREFFYCDSAALAVIHILNMLAQRKQEGSTLSGLVKEIVKYAYSGEINFEVSNKEAAIQKVKKLFEQEKPVRVFNFDGIRCEYADFWYNLRLSNTENYVRLVCEAKTNEKMQEVIDKISSALQE